MAIQLSPQLASLTPHLTFDASAKDDLLTGGRVLGDAFLRQPTLFADRGTQLVPDGTKAPPVLLVQEGFAYRAYHLPDGRRAVLDVLIPGDMIGLDHILVADPIDAFIAASRIAFSSLDASDVRQLMEDRPVAVTVYAHLAEARWRAYRLAVSIGRLDAAERLCLLFLDIYDRLQRRSVINQRSFNLPLTQEQIADHLGLTVVHVNRTLRRLRTENIVMFDRQVVNILNLPRMRELARGLADAERRDPGLDGRHSPLPAL